MHQWTRRTPKSPLLPSSLPSVSFDHSNQSTQNPLGNPCEDWSITSHIPDIDWFAATPPNPIFGGLESVTPTVDTGLLDNLGLVDTAESYNGLQLFDFDAPDQLFVEMESSIANPVYSRDPLFDYANMPHFEASYRDTTSSSPDTLLASLSPSTPQQSSLMSSLTTSPSSSLGVPAPSGYPPILCPPVDATSNKPSASSKRKSSDRDEDADEDDVKANKRQRNTMAARKYRQKRLDLIADLEKALEEMTAERDELKLRLARKDAEAGALREMLAKK